VIWLPVKWRSFDEHADQADNTPGAMADWIIGSRSLLDQQLALLGVNCVSIGEYIMAFCPNCHQMDKNFFAPQCHNCNEHVGFLEQCAHSLIVTVVPWIVVGIFFTVIWLMFS
jgi:hypothetical protein